MTFTQWYTRAHKTDWHEDFALLYGHCEDVQEEYVKYCEENKLKPIWNG